MSSKKSKAYRALAGTLVVGALITGGGTLAQMQSSATSAAQVIQSGDLSMSCDNGTFEMPITNIAAGDGASRRLLLGNTSSTAFAAGSVTLVPTSTGGSALTTTPQGMSVSIYDGQRLVMPAIKVVDWKTPIAIDLTAAQLAAGASTPLTFAWTLDPTAPNTYQGLKDSVTFTCAAAQDTGGGTPDGDEVDATVPRLPNATIAPSSNQTSRDKTTVSWPAVPGATGYDLQYRPVGSIDWTVVNIPGTAQQTTIPTTPNAKYDVEIRAIVGATVGPYGGTSVVSGAAPTGLVVSRGQQIDSLSTQSPTSASGFIVADNVVAGANGDVYVDGSFSGTTVDGMAALNSGQNYYLTKYNGAGVRQWTKVYPNLPGYFPPRFSYHNGVITAVGSYKGTTAFGNKTLVDSTPTAASSFLVRYAEDGTTISAVDQGDLVSPRYAAGAPNGSVWTSGNYAYGQVRNGVTWPSPTSGNGKYLMEIKPDGSIGSSAPLNSNGQLELTEITTGPDSSVVVTGHFAGTMKTGSTTILTAASITVTEPFVVKFSSTGALAWAKSGTTKTGLVNAPGGLDVGAGGDVYISSNTRIASLDGATGALKNVNATLPVQAATFALTVDEATNSVYLAGSYNGGTTAVPFGPSVLPAQPKIGTYAYISRLGTDLKIDWAKGFGGQRTDSTSPVTRVYGSDLDSFGNLVEVGSYTGSISVDGLTPPASPNTNSAFTMR